MKHIGRRQPQARLGCILGDPGPLTPLFDDGMLEAPLVYRALPLARGIEAYQAVATGAEGRIVIEP